MNATERPALHAYAVLLSYLPFETRKLIHAHVTALLDERETG